MSLIVLFHANFAAPAAGCVVPAEGDEGVAVETVVGVAEPVVVVAGESEGGPLAVDTDGHRLAQKFASALSCSTSFCSSSMM